MDNLYRSAAIGMGMSVSQRLARVEIPIALPVIIAARSSLGTINHSLLTIEALRNKNIAIAGLVMIGEINLENEKAVENYGEVKLLGRIPPLPGLDRESFKNTYTNFSFQR